MTSSFERSGPIVGGLLILASLALGAGTAERGPAPVLPAAAASEDGGAEDAAVTVPARPDAASPTAGSTAADDLVAEDDAPLVVMEGGASYYSDARAGRPTASGAPYRPTELIAAHRALPFGTRLRVTNLENDQSVEVRVIDRGPVVGGRIIDLSRSAAERIGMIRAGHVRVRIEVLSYPG